MKTNDTEKTCEEARRKVQQLLLSQLRLPDMVFAGEWRAFLFFDPDWLFSRETIELLQKLIVLDGSECVCIEQLDDANCFYVTPDTTQEAYSAVLAGPDSGDGWLYEFSRFGIASSSGGWCIYCERAQEIAVIAVHHNMDIERILGALSVVEPRLIEQAIDDATSYGFTKTALSESWARVLKSSYGAQSHEATSE